MIGQPIADLEKVTEVPSGSLYIANMGDGSGTKAVTQETLTKEVGKGLKVGDLAELQTENKNNLVAAINEAAQSGGGGAAVDILDTKEEIEANTESGKAAGAQAVKEMFGALNDNINGNILTYNESDPPPPPPHGADSVPKKLGSQEPKIIMIASNVDSRTAHSFDVKSLIPNDYNKLSIGDFFFKNVSHNAVGGSGATESKRNAILNTYNAQQGVVYTNPSFDKDGVLLCYVIFSLYVVY